MAASNDTKSKHPWKFFRAGGLDQVLIESGADLLALDKLDKKLWVALSCPTRGLEFDSRTLDMIDSDKDGRIRVPEVLEAVRWAAASLKNVSVLIKGGDSLALDAINDQSDSGKRLMDASRLVLANLGKSDATAICLADFADPARIYAKAQFNGDGVLTPDSVANPEIRKVLQDIIDTLGSVADRSGEMGASQTSVDLFYLELGRFVGWWDKALAPGAPPVMVLGESTPSAWDAIKAVRAKIDDYFARCRLAAFDLRAAAPLNRAETEFAAMSLKGYADFGKDVAGLPLARIEGERPLPLTSGLNPAWAPAMERLRADAVVPLIGPSKTALSESDWAAILECFAPYQAWLAAKEGAAVEKLGLARARQILAGSSRALILKTIAQDLSVAPAMAEIANVEKLLRYKRDLCDLLNNFVNFSHFYARDGKAIFQAGTLFMDGRACHLCVKVADAAAHAPVADLGKTYVAYCELSRQGAKDKLIIAAAFTGGDSDQLRVGRNGVFYDTAGQDWDATIIRTVEHAISIRQAFWSPYRRLGRMINEQVEKFASAREQAVMDKTSSRVETTATAVVSGTVPQKSRIDTGTLAAIGLIMTGLVTAASNVFNSFLNFVSLPGAWWKIPVICGIIMMAISGPAMLIAWLKLRRRDLGPILDGCGWAINGRVKLNMALGHLLTEVASVPSSATKSLEDLYPDEPPKIPKWAWAVITVLALVALAALLEYVGIFRRLGVDAFFQNLWTGATQAEMPPQTPSANAPH